MAAPDPGNGRGCPGSTSRPDCRAVAIRTCRPNSQETHPADTGETLGHTVEETDEQVAYLVARGFLKEKAWQPGPVVLTPEARPDGIVGMETEAFPIGLQPEYSALQPEQQPLPEPHHSAEVWSDSPRGTIRMFGPPDG
jgi:hypothetical protein